MHNATHLQSNTQSRYVQYKKTKTDLHTHILHYTLHTFNPISSHPGASPLVSLWKLTADRDWLFMSDLCCRCVCLCACVGLGVCVRKLNPDRDCVFMPVLLDSLYCCQERVKRKVETWRGERRRGDGEKSIRDVSKKRY